METSRPGGTSTRDLRAAAAVGAIASAALALRLIHLRAIHTVVVDQPPPEGMDRWLNTRIAEAIASGDWLGGWAAQFDSSPGYSFLLAALYSACGGRWLGPIVVQLVLGAMTPVLLYGLARRARSTAAGLLAALLGALYLPAIFYEGLLVKFSLVPFATALALYALWRLQEGARGWAIPAGAALGGLVLLRPNLLLLAPVVTWCAVRRERTRLAIRRAAFVGVGACLLLVPMAVRDHLAARRGVAAALGGIHFYMGTNPRADGEYVVLEGIRPDIVGHVVDARREAERRVGHQLAPAEVSRFWFERGIAFILENPGRYGLLQMRKLWFTLEANESGSFGDDFQSLRPASPVLRLPLVMFGTVLPLGLLGLIGSLRRRQPLLPVFSLCVVLSLLPFFVAGRYRLPLAPPMIVLAALGLDELHARWQRRGGRMLLVAVPALAFVAIVFGAGDAQVLTLLVVLGVGLLLTHWLSLSPPDGPSFSDVPESAQTLELARVDGGARARGSGGHA